MDRRCRLFAAVALLVRHWPAKGSRHIAFLALAGVLARSEWKLGDVKVVHRAIYKCLWPSDPDFAAADSEVKCTFEKLAGGGEVTGVPTLVELVEKRVVDAALRWLGIDRARRRDYHRNDTGNADRLSDLHGHELIYCTERNGY